MMVRTSSSTSDTASFLSEESSNDPTQATDERGQAGMLKALIARVGRPRDVLLLTCAAFGLGLCSGAALLFAVFHETGQLRTSSAPRSVKATPQFHQQASWVGDGVTEFERNEKSPYAVARDVCVWRRFEDCMTFTDRNDLNATSLRYTFEHFLKITPMTLPMKQAQIPGSTVLFTASHSKRYLRWNNIAHFANELIHLANFVDGYGHEFAERALVWQAPESLFTGAGSGFTTDWYIQSVRSLLLHGEIANTTPFIYTCDQVPLTTGKEHALCFERLVAFAEPRISEFNPSVCNHFKSRVYHRFGLSPAPDVSSHVLVLIRTDGQGWSNHDEAAEEIARYTKRVGGTIITAFLNRSRMTLKEQVRWFMDSGVVVTTHGAHEMNLMFARAGSFHIEYFKQNHVSGTFRKVAVSCGIRYIAAHAKGTRFSLHTWTRKYLDIPMPLDFHLELQPALQFALGVDVQGIQENAPNTHPVMIRTVSEGWMCADDSEAAAELYDGSSNHSRC
mmetsp:Transcript_25689/g.73383  ORF Transcript_25689/g.73383 Transcript_25689/m.73383 type:complete len:505 (-) Transcript_25689:243-1757(-)